MGQGKFYILSGRVAHFSMAVLPVVIFSVLVTDVVDATGEDASTTSADEEFKYTVQCEHKGTPQVTCQVDHDTYIGWTMFSIDCHQCHGENAEGTSFGPNLVQKLQEGLDFERFKEVVTHGMQGEMGVMPGWKDNSAVMAKLDALYRFLKARADGALPPGRPEPMK